MCKKFLFSTIFAIVLIASTVKSNAQTVVEPKDTPASWSQPYPPFRIVGNLYYVGTYDLACYLLVTEKGNVLINTGLANSAQLISENITALGFKLADTKILLTTQAHYDHMGAMAELKEKTGAKMIINQKDAQVMANGGSSDYALGTGISTYVPLKADKTLKDKQLIRIGSSSIMLLDHPGHTKGSSSFLIDIVDGVKTYRVLIANMPSIVTAKKFSEISSYPSIEKDYAYTLKELKNLKFDIWLASHASQFSMHKKHKPGDAYQPEVFIDQKGFEKALDKLQKAYDEKIATQ